MKRKLTYSAGVVSTVLYIIELLGAIALCGVFIVLMIMGDSLTSATNQNTGNTTVTGGVLGSMFTLIGGLMVVAGVIAIIVLIILLVLAKKVRRSSTLSPAEFQSKKGLLITFIVFNALMAIGAFSTIFMPTTGETADAALTQTTTIIAGVVIGLLALMICTFVIVDMVRNNKALANPNGQLNENEVVAAPIEKQDAIVSTDGEVKDTAPQNNNDNSTEK